ncbi:MAG: CHRD domain-containing protein [Acidobacteria bacterium]|nr:CHRD domain-containing protein [Acidobacteriota bacterium]
MRRLLAVGLLAVLLVACSDDGSPTVGPASTTTERPTTTLEPGTEPSTTTEQPAAGSTVVLTPAAVVGGGDRDGSGSAVIRLVPERAEVCYTLTVRNVDVVTQAHIHRGEAGQDGDAVLALTPPDRSGTITSCAAGDGILLEELQSSPSSFYLDVHSATFPKGALRGQLGEGGATR